MKIIKELIPYVIIFIVVVLIRSFIVTPVIVSGSSMDDTLSDGDILLLNKFDKNYERFDIIVFDYHNSKLVKRIIGLPGETIKINDGNIYINGELLEENYGKEVIKNAGMASKEIKLGESEYFVLGDNRNKSSDSRFIGLIDEQIIDGKTSFSIWPFGMIDK